MPSLLSGSTLRRGGSGEFIDLPGAQPQLPATDTTLTGFTLVTDNLLRTSYRSSLGFIEFNSATIYSSLPSGTIKILATGTNITSTGTTTGLLVVNGDTGIGGAMNIGKDIVVNGITIGRGYEGVNNLVFRGTAEPQIDDYENGQESIAIGYDSLLGLTSSYKSIAIGRYALSTGTLLSNNIAIGDSALKLVGIKETSVVSNITNIGLTNPVVVTSPGHGLTSGTYVSIFNVNGTTQLNSGTYYVWVYSSSTFGLYNDNNYSTPIDGTGFTSYIGSGTVEVTTFRDSNVSIGVDSGSQLLDGQQNVFIGHQAANLLTTGSYNIIIGPLTGQYLYTGSGIISIGGDNIVDGKDDQVNIGSVFYYDGAGYSYISAETTVGLGTRASIISTGTFTAASTVTGGLVVVGGAFVWDNLILGDTVNILGTGTSTIAGSLIPTTSTVSLGSASNPFASLYLNGTTLYLSTVTLKSYSGNSFSVESPDGYVTQTVGNLHLNSGLNSTSSNNGSLLVDGGIGVLGNANIGGELNVLGSDNVELSPVGATVRIKPSGGGTVDIRPNATGSIDNIAIGLLDPAAASFDTVSVLGNNVSTSTQTGALVVTGGVGIGGDIYSGTGMSDENYLLYTPRISVTAGIPPTNPRLGDFWIDSTIPAYLQYIKDGSNKFWIQVGAV